MVKKCVYCGRTYEGRSDSRFCSAKCKNTYHNKKRLGEIQDPENDENEDEDERLTDSKPFKPVVTLPDVKTSMKTITKTKTSMKTRTKTSMRMKTRTRILMKAITTNL